MKKKFFKFTNLFLVVIMVIALVPMASIPAFAATTYSNGVNIIINNVDIGYDTGNRFKHGSSTYGWQCYGFAEYCADKVYGVCYNKDTSQFTKTVVNAKISGNELKAYLYGCAPATHIRSIAGKYSSSSGTYYAHSWSVVNTYDTYLTIAEANYDWNNGIRMRDITYDELATSINSYGGLYRIVSFKNWSNNTANRVNLYETVAVTAKSSLTIRSQPNINSSSVGSLSSGAIVNVCNYPILDSSGYWWRKLVDGRGWVCWDYLKTISGTSMVNGNYRIQNANGKYLTYGNNPSNGIDIIMIDDMAGTDFIDYQIWNFTPYFYDNQSGAISYRIKPILSSSYSLDSDQTDNEVLHLWESHETNAQYWTVDIRSDGSLKIFSRGSGLVLDIYNASNENYAQVITYPSHDGNNQKFYLVTP